MVFSKNNKTRYTKRNLKFNATNEIGVEPRSYPVGHEVHHQHVVYVLECETFFQEAIRYNQAWPTTNVTNMPRIFI
jgi:hypothetical protein